MRRGRSTIDGLLSSSAETSRTQSTYMCSSPGRIGLLGVRRGGIIHHETSRSGVSTSRPITSTISRITAQASIPQLRWRYGPKRFYGPDH